MSGPEDNPRDGETIDRDAYKRWEIEQFFKGVLVVSDMAHNIHSYQLTDYQMEALFTILGHEDFWG
jgi:hypothetical protein